MKKLAKNKKALHDYKILDTIETGIVLLGSEVKSVKAGHIQLKGSYVSIRQGELWLIGAHISPYKQGEKFDTNRSRKLLAKKSEINFLFGKTNKTNLTLIPLEIYTKKGKIKVAVALAQGKKEYDKREEKKKKDIKKELKRKYKNIKI